MKITVVDGNTLNPGDLSWDELRKFGECEIYPRTPADLLIERCKDATAIITNKVRLLRNEIEQLPALKYIGVTATGYNNIDIVAAREKDIIVTNVPAYSTPSVAQLTFALIMEITNNVGLNNAAVQAGQWTRSADFSFWCKPIMELDNLTLGIVGYGSIGKKVAKIAKQFGMKILVKARSEVKDGAVKNVDINTLFKESDIVSLHCPLSDETYHIINEASLNLMKPNAILINTARGGLIDENALAKTLREKKIFAAALDVLDNEPPKSDCPLLNLENCIITPHIAWASLASRQRLLNKTIENLKAYFSGKLQNVVN